MKRFAYIQLRKNHPVLKTIRKLLNTAFHDFEMVFIPLRPELNKRPHWCLVNLLHVLRCYGISAFFNGKNRFHLAFYGTPYIFNKINELARKQMPDDLVFSIQENSLFNGCLKPIPHFIFTDNTAKESIATKSGFFDEGLYHQDWLTLEKTIYQDAWRIFTRTVNIVDSLKHEYGLPDSKLECIGFPPTILLEAPIDKKKYSSKTILFIGREWERKGGPTLLKAFLKCLESVPDARLVIIGCSPDIDHKQVEIFRSCAPSEILEWYQNAAVFSMPSEWEPYGNVCVEAMAAGLPLLLTNISAFPSFVEEGKNGYLISPGDATQLSKHMVTLMNSAELCQTMGAASLRIYEENYTFEAVAGSLRKRILECLSG